MSMRFSITFRALVATVLLACVAASAAHAQLLGSVQRFDEAAALYQQGEYRQAALAYEEVLATGYVTGALYFNMGNAYFRLDEYGQALRYWKKAGRLMGDTSALTHNIALVESLIESPFSSVPPPFWVAWWNRIVVPLGMLPYLIPGLLLYCIAVILFGILIRTRTRSAWQRRSRFAAATLGALLLLTAAGVSATETGTAQGVVLTDSTLEVPDEEETVDVPEGVVVSLLGRDESYVQVSLPNGITGQLPIGVVGDI